MMRLRFFYPGAGAAQLFITCFLVTIQHILNRTRIRSFPSSAWECSLGSSSFPTREAGASLTGFPSRSLGTSAIQLETLQRSVPP